MASKAKFINGLAAFPKPLHEPGPPARARNFAVMAPNRRIPCY